MQLLGGATPQMQESDVRKSPARAIDHRRGYGAQQVRPVVSLAQARARVELAGYIAQMTSELVSMASSARLDLLAHFLALARVEAELAARDAPPDP
jgi:hypothetical protein